MVSFDCVTGVSMDQSYLINRCQLVGGPLQKMDYVYFSNRAGFLCETVISKTENAWETVCEKIGLIHGQQCPAYIHFESHTYDKGALNLYIVITCAVIYFAVKNFFK